MNGLMCDFCGQLGVRLTGETDGVVVCIDHAARAEVERVERPLNAEGRYASRLSETGALLIEEGRHATLADAERETCGDCGHTHVEAGCSGPPTPSDLWAGVSPSTCDCNWGLA